MRRISPAGMQGLRGVRGFKGFRAWGRGFPRSGGQGIGSGTSNYTMQG